MITIADRGDGIYLVADTNDQKAVVSENVPGFIVHTKSFEVNAVKTQSALKMGYWNEVAPDAHRDTQINRLIENQSAR